MGASGARYEDHAWRTGPTAFQIYLAAASDFDQPREVLASHSMSDYRVKRVNKNSKEEKDASNE